MGLSVHVSKFDKEFVLGLDRWYPLFFIASWERKIGQASK